MKILAGAKLIGGFVHLTEMKVGEQSLSSPHPWDLHTSVPGLWNLGLVGISLPQLLHPQGILKGSKILNLWDSLNAAFDSSGKEGQTQQGSDLCHFHTESEAFPDGKFLELHPQSAVWLEVTRLNSKDFG